MQIHRTLIRITRTSRQSGWLVWFVMRQVCDRSSNPVSIQFPHQCPSGQVPPNDMILRFGWQPCIQMIPIHLRTGSHRKRLKPSGRRTRSECANESSPRLFRTTNVPRHQRTRIFARLDEPVCAASNDACRHCCVTLWFGKRLIPECRTKTDIRSMHVMWKTRKQVNNPAMILLEAGGAIGATAPSDRQPRCEMPGGSRIDTIIEWHMGLGRADQGYRGASGFRDRSQNQPGAK
jgi:hypothetical protein